MVAVSDPKTTKSKAVYMQEVYLAIGYIISNSLW